MSTGLAPETIPESSPEMRLSFRRALRQQAIDRRLALSPEKYTELSAIICTLLQTRFPQLSKLRVGFCWPVNNEPDLRLLIQSWIKMNASGFTALLPVVEAPGKPLAFREWTPASKMAFDRFGIPTPTDGPFIIPEALLIPVNAFDNAGYRIGYGGGFFDRTLVSINPAPLAIGVGFELSRIDSVHPEPHDVRLDAMVSEAGVFTFT